MACPPVGSDLDEVETLHGSESDPHDHESCSSDGLGAQPIKLRRGALGPLAASTDRRAIVDHMLSEASACTRDLPPLPNGPMTVDEFAAWPKTMCDRLLNIPPLKPLAPCPGSSLARPMSMVDESPQLAKRKFCLQVMGKHGIVVHTDYSGKQSPEAGFRIAETALVNAGIELSEDWCRFWRATDVAHLCQRLIMIGPHAPAHVFPGVQHLLPLKSFDAVCALRPPGHPKKAAVQKEEAAQAYTQQARFLDRSRPHTWDLKRDGCLLHPDTTCHVCWQATDDDRQSRIKWAVAGTQCTPFTTFGKRLGLSDPDTEAYNIWSSHVTSLPYDIVVLENSSHFPISMFREQAEPDAQVFAIIVGPELVGWPLRRTRLFAVSVRRSSMLWLGPETDEEVARDFFLTFGAKTKTDAAFFSGVDTEQQRADFMKSVCESRGTWASSGNIADLSARVVLPPGEKRNLDKLQRLVEECPDRFLGPSGRAVCDVSQNPERRRRLGHLMPPLMRSSKLMCIGTDCEPALLTPAEVSFAHGWPSIPSAANKKYEWAAAALQRLTPSQQQTLSGNGMHLPIFTSWLLYIAAHTFPRAEVEGLPPRLTDPTCVAQGIAKMPSKSDAEFDFEDDESASRE